MGHFLTDSTYAQLADSLLETNHVVAAQFGGIAFEQMVRERVPHSKNWDDKDLIEIIDGLYNEGTIDTVTRGIWHRARLTRNKAMHMNPPPTFPEAQQLVELLHVSARD